MSQKKGAKGPCPEAAKPRKKARSEEILSMITRRKQAAFAGLRNYRAQTKEE